MAGSSAMVDTARFEEITRHPLVIADFLTRVQGSLYCRQALVNITMEAHNSFGSVAKAECPRQVKEVAPTHLPGKISKTIDSPKRIGASDVPGRGIPASPPVAKDEPLRVLQTLRRDQADNLCMNLPYSEHTAVCLRKISSSPHRETARRLASAVQRWPIVYPPRG